MKTGAQAADQGRIGNLEGAAKIGGPLQLLPMVVVGQRPLASPKPSIAAPSAPVGVGVSVAAPGGAQVVGVIEVAPDGPGHDQGVGGGAATVNRVTALVALKPRLSVATAKAACRPAGALLHAKL